MKRALAFIARNWLTSVIGLCQLAGVAFAVRRDPARLMSGEVLGALSTGLVLLASRDPAKVRAFIARLSTPLPTSGMDESARKD